MAEDCETVLRGASALARATHLREEATRIEREAIADALARADGSEKRAAEILGITRTRVHELLRHRYADIGKAARDARVAARGHAGGGHPRRGQGQGQGHP